MPEPAENPVVSTPKGAPVRDTASDTAAPAETGQKLLQSVNGDRGPQTQTTDQSQAQPPTTDNRTLWVSEFMDARLRRPQSTPESTAAEKPTAETVAKGLAELEQSMKRSGTSSTHLDGVTEQFDSLRQRGQLPEDLGGMKQMLDRMNRMSASDTLSQDTAGVMLRLVAGNLEGKVHLLTPENVQALAENPILNRENPNYAEGQTNCRACTASFIMNERLSDRAMAAEFGKILNKLDAGEIGGKSIYVPLENGAPKMTATLYQVNHGATHSGTAGIVHTRRAQEDFQRDNPPVPDYIQRGLREAGFHNMTLTGGPTKPGVSPLKDTGYYILEHGVGSSTSDQVNGHVTAGIVHPDGKVERVDAQIPENRTKPWLISSAFKVEIGNQATEEKTSGRNPDTGKMESTTRVINPDGTVRSFQNYPDGDPRAGQLRNLIDVDGRSYFRSPDGKWQSLKQGVAVDAPFKKVEYLGVEEGTRFTFEDRTVTEKPNGTAEISVPDHVVSRDGVAVKLNGSDAKVSDLVSKITRETNGKFTVDFKDNSQRSIALEAPGTQPQDVRNIKQLQTQLSALEGGQNTGTADGGALNRSVMARITEEAKGGDAASAVIKLLKPNVSGADINRMALIAEAMKANGMATDPSSVSNVDKIMTELRLTPDQIGKAKAVFEKAQEHLKAGKGPLTEAQAIEIAILQNTQDPSKPTGKNYTEPTARAKLKKVDEIRTETRQKDMALSTALEVNRVREQYPGYLINSFTKSPARNSAATDRGNEIRRVYKLAQDPKALADAEATYQKLGGAASKLTLMDAAAINEVPELKENPKLAVDVMQTAVRIRGDLMSRSEATANRYTAADYLKMGLIGNENELNRQSSAKTSVQIEAEYSRAVNQAKLEAFNSQEAPTGRRTALGEAAPSTGDSAPRPSPNTALRPPGDATAAGAISETKPAGDATTLDTAPGASTGVQADSFRVQAFREKLAALDALSPGQMFDEYCKTALRETAGSVNRRHRPGFASTAVAAVESSTLNAGDSKLAFIHQGHTIDVRSVDTTGAPAFVTADGTKVRAQDCQVQVQYGKGSTKDQVAREALVCSNELRDLYEGKPCDSAQRAAMAQALKTAFDHGTTTDSARQGVSERVANLGAFELTSGREPILLSESGVKFGGKPEVSFESLVKDTLRDKRQHLERLEKSKTGSANAELDGQIKILNEQIADLDHLSRNVHRPETITKLMDTIKRHATTEEIARIRAEQATGGGVRFKGAATRAGTYSLVAAFVAQMIYREGGQQEINTGYAPTSSQ
ncbi:MAG: hypothetical protein SGJ27_16420 [Candidatus Melainabacteria bacterium]|nr:hypothetical protein [Candidatus Melainabacteria bacterium]